MQSEPQSTETTTSRRPRPLLVGLYLVVLVGGILLALQVRAMMGLDHQAEDPADRAPRGRPKPGAGLDDDFADLMIGSDALTGPARPAENPLGIAQPESAQRIWARQWPSRQGQLAVAHYRVAAGAEAIVEYYTTQLTGAGFEALDETTDPRGRRVLPFTRDGERAVVILRTVPGNENMHMVWFSAIRRPAD
jgi:hypothetical protein